MRELLQIIRTKFDYQKIFVVDSKNASRWQSGMLSGWKITSIGDSLINLCQMRYCMAAAGHQQYEIHVLGDDVCIELRKVKDYAVIQAMNEIGLIQQPDKTIKSYRYAEFLRSIYDCQEKEMRGYPTRMIPSVLFNKPWLNPFMEDEYDGNSAVSRLKAWRTLARRMKLQYDDNQIVEVAALDLLSSSYTSLSKARMMQELKSPLVQLDIQSRYKKD